MTHDELLNSLREALRLPHLMLEAEGQCRLPLPNGLPMDLQWSSAQQSVNLAVYLGSPRPNARQAVFLSSLVANTAVVANTGYHFAYERGNDALVMCWSSALDGMEPEALAEVVDQLGNAAQSHQSHLQGHNLLVA